MFLKFLGAHDIKLCYVERLRLSQRKFYDGYEDLIKQSFESEMIGARSYQNDTIKHYTLVLLTFLSNLTFSTNMRDFREGFATVVPRTLMGTLTHRDTWSRLILYSHLILFFILKSMLSPNYLYVRLSISIFDRPYCKLGVSFVTRGCRFTSF